jgi:transposase
VDTSFFVFKESQMSKVRPPYPAEFRQQMVELVRAGRSPAELSREFGVTAQSVTNWVGQAAIDEGKPLPGKESLTTAERDELVLLSLFTTYRPIGFRHIGATSFSA